MDQNFGTNLGADFRAPVTDAGVDTNVTPDAAATGGAAGQATGGADGQATGGAAGQATGGATGQGTGGATGQGGMAGAG